MKQDENEPKVADEVYNPHYLNDESHDLQNIHDVNLQIDENQVFICLFPFVLVLKRSILLPLNELIHAWIEETLLVNDFQVSYPMNFDVPKDTELLIDDFCSEPADWKQNYHITNQSILDVMACDLEY